MYDAFESRDTVVIAIAQEDKDLDSFGKIHERFKAPAPFDIVADFERRGTQAYERTSTYFIDRAGVVRQVFPNTIRHRADWQAVLNEIDRLVPRNR